MDSRTDQLCYRAHLDGFTLTPAGVECALRHARAIADKSAIGELGVLIAKLQPAARTFP